MNADENTPRDEGDELFGNLSFDVPTFKEHLDTDDSLQLIIRAHLYVENILIEFITLSFDRPEVMDLDRLSFPVKIQLAAAMGALPEFYIGPFNHLNNLRNKVAHNLDYGITDEHKSNFFATLPRHIKEAILSDGKLDGSKRSLDDLAFKKVLRSFIVLFDACRIHYAEHIRKRQEAIVKARELLERIDKDMGQ